VKTGLFDIDEVSYHADPCEVPSLSQSIATTLINRSPAHAYAEHPKLGGTASRHSKTFDEGHAIHAMLLGKGADFVVVDAEDWRSKAAREKRDAAREQGKTPLLAQQHEDLVIAAAEFRKRLGEHEEHVEFGGHVEVVAMWVEMASDGTQVQCRGRLDHFDGTTIDDLKTSKNASPDKFARSAYDYGYDIQAAAYRSAIESIFPRIAGRVGYRLILCELAEPWPVAVARPTSEFFALGEARWRRAVDAWARCLKHNDWPAYNNGRTYALDPPGWAMARELENQSQMPQWALEAAGDAQ